MFSILSMLFRVYMEKYNLRM